ncbi:zf-HC2 domain-containing protein [Deinococcus cellulosilyticus]|uniref:Zinc-finger domain-containing protein n=1 Tax=Deinococcus cellulosilyticus (strain DSM 18568 / NBRC 106333 / KACC 11606 / 5516J-15) TaxID=1223518 RepID=A0A511N7X7_DEIC1|nr:zf-HC2 domain-containing protein [Deinococcus cellulosilyticus]GEM48945.1 hypothetical protein DC3_45800 [Deinococcus cellulosilyticus NBRC 106333 = KACC 11606]
MKCEDAQLRISDLLSQGRAADSDPEVLAHLESCPECQIYAQDLSEVMMGLLHVEPVEAPSGLKDRIFSKLHGGLSCEQAQTLVVDRITGGIETSDETALQQHLDECQGCQDYAQDMDLVVTALPHSAPDLRPPPDLKNQVLKQVREGSSRKPSRQLQWWGLGLAATVTGVLWAGGLLSPSASAGLAPDPSVVVSAGETVVFANSSKDAAPIVILNQDGKATGLKLQMDEVPYFTEGVAAGPRVYLLDTANQHLIVVNLESRRVERTHKVHAGASGLSVRNGQIFVKCALSGFLTSIREDGFVTEIKLAATREIPREEFMDAVLQKDNLLLVTHHMRGKVFLVNPDTLQVHNTLDVGGEPVALSPYGDRVLVLDHAGRLLELTGNKITRELALEGHPDKMTIASGQAYLSDRSGQVSKVDLVQWKVVKTAQFGTPMDIETMPGGKLLLADARQGINMLDSNLQVMEQVE